MADDTKTPSASPPDWSQISDPAVVSPLAAFHGDQPPAPAWFQHAIEQRPERTFVEVDGAAIEMLAWGARGKPGVLFLHGNGAHADWWSFIAPFFAGEFRVVAISWAGMGRSGWRERYAIDSFVRDALACTEAGGLFEAKEKPVVVAHSFGGSVATSLAAQYGQRLKATVIVDSGARPPEKQWRGPPQRQQPNRVYATLEEALGRFRLMPPQGCPNLYIVDYIAREGLHPAPITEGADAGEQGWTWRFDPFIWSKMDFSKAWESGEELARAQCRLAFVWGAQSKLMTPDVIDYSRSHAAFGTPFVEIPESEHHVLLDQPLALVSALRTLSPAGDERAVKSVLITPSTAPLVGRAAPPGSKSITNRALLLAALANGTSRLTGALKSDDTARMAEALAAMGVSIEEPDATTFVVTGDGRLRAPDRPLFLGNAGTATRFLTAAAALVDGTVVIDGDAHMRRRPIAPLVEALRTLGVDATAPSGCPPLTVRGCGGLDGGRVEIDAGLSSQYVSALLMLAGKARGPVEIALKGADIGARGYVDLTIAAIRAFGGQIEAVGEGKWIVSPTGYRAADLKIEPDASAATYLWATEKLTGGAIDLGMAAGAFTQPDAKAYDLIAAFPHMPAVIDGAQMQDAVPTLAVLAAFNETPVRFTGIANLRVKECDRIRALSTELSRIRAGLAVEDDDDLIVTGDPSLAGQTSPARIETYADHRIAMSFAIACLKIGGVTILDPDCVAKTWPSYWDALAGLGVELRFENA